MFPVRRWRPFRRLRHRYQCSPHIILLLSCCHTLGFQVYRLKSALSPSQSFVSLGVAIPLPGLFTLPLDASSIFFWLSSAFGALLRPVPGLLWRSWAPWSPSPAWFRAPVQRALRVRWSQTLDPWDSQLPLGQWFLESTDPWLDRQWLTQGVPLSLPPPDLQLFTDASNQGWGAHLVSLSSSGVWSPHLACVPPHQSP